MNCSSFFNPTDEPNRRMAGRKNLQAIDWFILSVINSSSSKINGYLLVFIIPLFVLFISKFFQSLSLFFTDPFISHIEIIGCIIDHLCSLRTRKRAMNIDILFVFFSKTSFDRIRLIYLYKPQLVRFHSKTIAKIDHWFRQDSVLHVHEIVEKVILFLISFLLVYQI